CSEPQNLDNKSKFGGFYMIKYDLDFKINLVSQYLSGVSARILAREYHIGNPASIDRWVGQYQKYGLKGLEPRVIRSQYSREFKASVLNWKQQHHATIEETALHFNIPASGTISRWQNGYAGGGNKDLTLKRKGRQPMNKHKAKKQIKKPAAQPNEKPNDDAFKQLQRENEQLRIENAYLKKLDALARQKLLSRKSRKS
ncbi:helix-turn-helix domain-containing protein, partial [Lacticaseibacillus songhuajiangensis]|uniref:helix-turn-helix domain-containing protein n=1 Tax=Lacticaseibacillus songhuajiangensis TaxID=1296539 RepID=UPI001CDC6E4F